MPTLEHLKAMAEQGDAHAQFQFAYECYESFGNYGLSKEKKDARLSKALPWYLKAAEQGNARAQYRLATMYAYGEGVEQDGAKAVKWLRKCANQGDVTAQEAVGHAYYNGAGVEKNYAKALKWYRKAANRGSVGAEHKIRHIKWEISCRPPKKPKRPYVNSTVFYKIDTINEGIAPHSGGGLVLHVQNFPLVPYEAFDTVSLTEYPKASRWYKRLKLEDDVVGMIITPDNRGLHWVEHILMEMIRMSGRFYVGQGLVEGLDQSTGEEKGHLVAVKCARKAEGVIQVVQQWFTHAETHAEAHPEVTPELEGVSQDLAKMLEAILNPPLNPPLDT